MVKQHGQALFTAQEMPEGQPHRHSPPAVMKELQIEPVMIVST
jgi:hypothetical protein